MLAARDGDGLQLTLGVCAISAIDPSITRVSGTFNASKFWLDMKERCQSTYTQRGFNIGHHSELIALL